jgi:hypothetical protein
MRHRPGCPMFFRWRSEPTVFHSQIVYRGEGLFQVIRGASMRSPDDGHGYQWHRIYERPRDQALQEGASAGPKADAS